jgi:hypothetical protein
MLSTAVKQRYKNELLLSGMSKASRKGHVEFRICGFGYPK